MARLKKKEIEKMYVGLEKPLDDFIGNLDIYKAKYYNSVMYNKEVPVFAISGGQLYYNKSFFHFFLESGIDKKLFEKVIKLWFEKKYSVPIGYVGWSESFEKDSGF
jgi:hypothetical protein